MRPDIFVSRLQMGRGQCFRCALAPGGYWIRWELRVVVWETISHRTASRCFRGFRRG